MTKKIYFVRHGQSEANVLFYAGRVAEARAIRDPGLSEVGRGQARAVRDEYKDVLAGALELEPTPNRVDLLVVSPMRRTIQTAMLAFGEWLAARAAAGSPLRICLAPDIQETGDVACDCGSPASALRDEFGAEYPFLPFDTLPEDWCEKIGPYVHTGEALAARYRKFTCWLRRQPEHNVLVVGHHNVYLGMLGVSFINCEVRAYLLPRSSASVGAGNGADAAQGDGGDAEDKDLSDVPPLVPPWEAFSPKVTQDDSQLSEKDLAWLNNPTQRKHNHEKFVYWQFREPARLR